MNGANALPAVSEMITPSNSNKSTSGSSQNFFRILKKSHISRTSDTYLMLRAPSIQLAVPLHRVLAFGLFNPIRRLPVAKAKVERRPSEHPQRERRRRQQQEEERRENHARHHPRHRLGHLHPLAE